jgi:hypothetical protein
MQKQSVKLIMLGITLSVALGCVSSGSGPYQLYARPYAPLAITNPAKVFLQCGGNSDAVESLYYCVERFHLSQLREYLIRVHSLLNKYEHQTEAINE